MREVVDGVIQIPIGYVNAYAVVVDDGVVLVDTGIPGRADKLARAIEAARRPIGEVHTILLTHWHPDHVGSVAELRSPRIASPSCGASHGSGTSVLSRPYSGTVERYPARRRSGSGSSPHAASDTTVGPSAGCSIAN